MPYYKKETGDKDNTIYLLPPAYYYLFPVVIAL